MGYKRQNINGTSPLDIKNLNDNFMYLWHKVFGDISMSDMSEDVIKTFNSKVGSDDVNSIIQQSPEDIKIGFNGINDVIEMDSNGLQVNHTDGSYSRLEGGAIKRYIAGTEKTYHCLTYVGQINIPDNNEYVTIQLPDEWKNKDFYATVGVAAINNITNGYAVKNFIAQPDSYDRPNGRFTIRGYMEVFNISTPNTIMKINTVLSYTVIA